jgi:hypothetical protein
MARLPRPGAALAAALLVSLVLAACGSSSSKTATTPPPVPKPTASAADFPSAKGKTLQDIQRGLPNGPIFAPAVSLVDKGDNRFGFALFDAARKQITGAPAAMYVSKTDGTDLSGPYVARAESLRVPTQYLSKTSAQDPDAAHSIYVSNVKFPTKGKYAVTALARVNGKMVQTTTYEVQAGAPGSQPPKVGETAPKIDTLTPADVGGDLTKLDTRVPPAPQLNKVNFADVYGKKPIALLFATPLLCQSRVCGPVEDIMLEEQAKGHGNVQFIHQEIYNDNEIKKGFRKQVGAYHLPSEPWLFVIDKNGKVVDRLEGAFSAGEVERALAKVDKQ